MTDESLQHVLVNLTRDLMLIQSDEFHPENQKKCLQIARYRLESLENVVLRDFEKEGHSSLVALPLGLAEPDVMMVTHLDVVSHELEVFPDPRIEKDRIIGPGAGDMKGIVAICLKVFEDLHRAHPGISLGMIISTDEEVGGLNGVSALLQDKGLRAGVALVPDGGSPSELSIAEKGILHLHLNAKGHETHAARPWLGVNAVETLLDDCQRIKTWVEALETDDDGWAPSCSITGFHSPNQSANIVPSLADAMMDIRFPSPHKGEDLLTSIRGMLTDQVTVSSSVTSDPSVLNPDPVYEQCMSELSSSPIEHVKNEGGSDGRHFTGLGMRVNMSRPLVGNIHGDDEWIDIPSMLEFYELYVRYIRAATKS